MVRVSRPTCTWTWEENGHIATCERYAVVAVGGEKYCEKHANNAPTSDR